MIIIFVIATGISIHRIVFEGNYHTFYWKGFDPISLLFGALAFFVSIIITIKIYKNTEEQNKLKEEEIKLRQEQLDKDNSHIKKKTDEIQYNINSLLNQYKNVEVVSSFKEIMEQLDLLYTTTIDAQNGEIEYNSSKIKIAMQLKIMNHSASFGRLLCSDVEVLKKQDSNFEETSKNSDDLKELIIDTRKKQKVVYNKMKNAFSAIGDKNNKYYITLSATKNIKGEITDYPSETAYYSKYLSKLNIDEETCDYDNFDDTKRFVQKVNGAFDFKDYFIKIKQQKQILELLETCDVFDAYSFNIPYQAFVTLPKDSSITSEKFYRCIFFFINDNTIGKGLQLSAICTSNIDFVKSVSKALDAEKATLVKFENDTK
jgi:FtsZ-binding cell division protein ZapB